MTRRRRGSPWTCYSERYEDIPEYLYFVEHAGSQSCEDEYGNFWAADTCTTGRRGLSHLQESIEQHIDWFNRDPTCFISTFDDYRHARNWARGRRGQVTIHTIDTKYVDEDDPPIFYAPDFTENCFDTSEYLFLDYISADCIVRSRTLS